MNLSGNSKGEWPPKPHDIAAKAMRLYDIWYDGDVDKLSDTYGNGQHLRPAQMAGGVIGAVTRFFWGQPNPQGSSRLHVPAAADLARASSDLLFAETPKFEYPAPDGEEDKPQWLEAAQERLDLIFNNDYSMTALSESGEYASVHGGVYYRLWWDSDIEDHVMWAPHPANAAIPTFVYNRLKAVTFWHELDTGLDSKTSKVLRHLERHEVGRIIHKLYEGTADKIGYEIPLDQHPSTKSIGKITKDGVINTGIDKLTASYAPQRVPGEYRKTPGLKALGRSDFYNLDGMFDALDEAMTSWQRDIRTGKSRVMVEEGLLKNLGPGRGGAWDGEQEVFTPLKTGLGGGLDGSGPGIEQVQFKIRLEEHKGSVAEILNVILRNAGLSAAQFSDTDLSSGQATATEINARNGLSERTRRKRIPHFRAALVSLAEAAMELDALVFGTGIQPEDKPSVVFPVQSMQNEGEKTDNLSKQRNNDLVSIRQGVKTLHPNWTPAEIEEEITEIRKDQLMSMKLAFGKMDEDTAETPDMDGVEGGLDIEDVDDMEERAEDIAQSADEDDTVIQRLANRLAGDLDGSGD